MWYVKIEIKYFKMAVYNIEPREFNVKLAEELKKIPEFQVADWVFLVKSGSHRQRVPEEQDFWFKRAASILRFMYTQNKPLGVSKLRTRYGGRKDRGVKPGRFRKSGGKMIRLLLQQAEKAGLIEKTKAGKAGRMLTEKEEKCWRQ